MLITPATSMPATPVISAIGTGIFELSASSIATAKIAIVTSDTIWSPAKAAEFEHYIRRFWPGVDAEHLTPDYAGIRPKLHGPGEPQPDFRIDGPQDHGVEGLVALFGIESPGLTSSLAIGEEVAGRLGL